MFMQNKKYLLWQNKKYSGEKELSFRKFITDYDNTEHIFFLYKGNQKL